MARNANENLPQRGETDRHRNYRKAMLQVEQTLQGLRYGQVTVVVQDGIVVQIDRLERMRLPRRADSTPPAGVSDGG
jgi:hypothetical protein